MPQALTYAEAAARAGVHRNTIVRAIQSGKLRYTQFASVRTRRIESDDLEAYIESTKSPVRGSAEDRHLGWSRKKKH